MWFRTITELTADDLIAVKDNRRGNSGDDVYISASDLARILQGLGIGGLAGSGSPEGVIAALPGTPYLNVDTESVWFKKTGTGNTGWITVLGPG